MNYIPSFLSTDYELARITKRDDVYVMVEYRVSSRDVSVEELSDYEAIEYEGKTYYRWDEHAENNPEKPVIGYEIAFFEHGNLIFMHLPAVDTFENMMKYANVVKVDIN